MKLAIKTKRLISPLQEFKDAVILINGDQIEAVGEQKNIEIPPDYQVKDVGNKIVAPGLVDIHNHGANGYFAREGEKAVQEISKWLAKTGTTCWLATIGDADERILEKAYQEKRFLKHLFIPCYALADAVLTKMIKDY